MKNYLSKLQHLLFVVLLLALAGCGTTSSNTVAEAPGAITAKLQWANGKTAAKTVALPAGVVKMRLGVTGATIPAVKKDIDVSGGQTLGTIDGIYPGKNLTLTVLALDGSNNVLFEGAAFGIDLGAGETKDAGIITMVQAHTRVADAACLTCHETKTDTVTGRNIIASVKSSAHYTNDSASGCVGCHGANHNDSNPAESGKCFTCHSNLGPKHFNAAAVGDAKPSRYLNATNSNCNACHEPHNPINGLGNQERKDWAASGHGDVMGAAWEHYDFTTRDTCAACHTAGGFVKAMGNGWTDTTKLVATSVGKQPLTCDGCHSSYDFKNSVRTLGAYKAGMAGYGTAAKANIQFPNVGESNLCIPCHSGRENGASIIATATAGSGFKNPHYLAAAAVFYGKGGFRYYGDNGTTGTPAVAVTTAAGSYTGNVPAYSSEYGVIVDGIIVTSTNSGKTPLGSTLTSRYAPWSHGKLGMDNYTTSGLSAGNTGKIRGSGNKGQCVACHLGPKNTHTFGAFEAAKATWGTAANVAGVSGMGCYGCHNGEDMEEVATFEEKPVFDRLMAFFKWNLQQYGLYYDSANNPYFFTAPYVVGGTNTAFTNWAVPVGGGVSDFQKTMGAAHNFKLIDAEKGAHVHNRAYMRHLIFDSIQYLQFGAVKYSNSKFYGQAAGDGDTALENVVKFSSYSTALKATPDTIKNADGTLVSIQQLKNYIITSSSRSNPINLTDGTVPATATYGAMKYFRR